MTSTKIEWSFNKIARMADLSDLAEMLFPGNRNHQHAFLSTWLAIKWSDHGIVPNLSATGEKHGISRRTLERVRAKMRRIGLIDHVSRFNANWNYREGWILSTRFERSMRQLILKLEGFKNLIEPNREKDMLLLQLAEARRDVARHDSDQEETEGGGGDDE